MGGDFFHVRFFFLGRTTRIPPPPGTTYNENQRLMISFGSDKHRHPSSFKDDRLIILEVAFLCILYLSFLDGRENSE